MSVSKYKVGDLVQSTEEYRDGVIVSVDLVDGEYQYGMSMIAVCDEEELSPYVKFVHALEMENN